MPKSLEDLKHDFETFLTQTEIARLNSARDRDYVDHNQWTAEELATLQARKQAPVVINLCKENVNFLSGVERGNREDPRALPRTPEHEDAADAATDGLRYVADNVDFDSIASDAFESDYLVWGIEAAITEVSEKASGEFEIQVNRIDSDRFYYDAHSRRKDFKDAKFMGVSVWMDEDDILAQFEGVTKDDLDALLAATTDTVDGSTFDDQPKWFDRERKRIRVCQHYYEMAGVWYLTYFTDNLFLQKPQESPLLDEDGRPCNPIEAQSPYIDREGNRYGEVRSWVWPQDEVNHRRSKAMYQLSVRQTMGLKGAVADINVTKRELAKADGHIELLTADGPFEILENQDLTQGQLAMYQDAKDSIRLVGPKAELMGDPSSAGMSGRAIQAIQQGGMTSLSSLFDGHKYWKRRIYRQMWNRIKQYWDAEKWVRVTDDEDKLKWVGLNQPVTVGQQLQEAAKQGDKRAVALLQEMLAMQDPRLNEVAEVRNNVAELDVDIILSETPNVANIQQEQFDQLAALAQTYGPEAVPFEVMLRLSSLPNKSEVEEMLKGEPLPPEVQEEQEAKRQMAEQLQFRGMAAKVKRDEAAAAKDQAAIAKTQADIGKTTVETEEQQIENEMVLAGMLAPEHLNA